MGLDLESCKFRSQILRVEGLVVLFASGEIIQPLVAAAVLTRTFTFAAPALASGSRESAATG